MAIQVHKLPNNTTCVHHCTLDGLSSRFSIWMGPDGKIQDGERLDWRDTSYPLTASQITRLESRYGYLGKAAA